MDLAVWLDGARPPKSNVCNYIKIKIAEVYFNDIQFGGKSISQWKLLNSFVWGIILQQTKQTQHASLQWKGINCKQCTRWQHLSRLKASAFFSLQKNLVVMKHSYLYLGLGTAIWWATEPH